MIFSPGQRTRPISIIHLSSRVCQKRHQQQSPRSLMHAVSSYLETQSQLIIFHLLEISLRLLSRLNGSPSVVSNRENSIHMVQDEAMMRLWPGEPSPISALLIDSLPGLDLPRCTGLKTRKCLSSKPQQSTSSPVHLQL